MMAPAILHIHRNNMIYPSFEFVGHYFSVGRGSFVSGAESTGTGAKSKLP